MNSGIPDANLRAEKDTVLKHEQAGNLAERLVPDGEHEESDQVHRQHDRERENRHRAGKSERTADLVGNNKGKSTQNAPTTSAELGCRISWMSRATLRRRMIRHTR